MAKKREPVSRARRGENVNEVYNKLFRRLIRGDLKAGDRVRELEIAEQVGSSRTPVREALQRLEQEGLLQRSNSGSLNVVALDHTKIAELYVMREILESTAAQLAAKHATPPEVLSLRKIVDDQHAAIGESGRSSLTNRVFHNTIFKMARNQYLLRSMSTLSGPLAILPISRFNNIMSAEEAVAEHEAIVDAIATNDVAEAGKAASRHVQSSYRARLGDLFDELYDSDLMVSPLGWNI